MEAQTIILVEGVSDQRALASLALRRGRDLAADGVSIVPMGGSKNIASYLDRFGPRGRGLKVAGLCDEAEEGDFMRAVAKAGLGSAHLTRARMEALGFFVCVRDLEDELIRALGPPAVEAVIEARSELDSFRSFQRQPEWRDRSIDQQLRRFLGTHSGRKIESAALLVEALDLDRIPRPLDLLLAHI